MNPERTPVNLPGYPDVLGCVCVWRGVGILPMSEVPPRSESGLKITFSHEALTPQTHQILLNTLPRKKDIETK